MRLSKEKLDELFKCQQESRDFGDKDDELIDPLLDTIRYLQDELSKTVVILEPEEVSYA